MGHPRISSKPVSKMKKVSTIRDSKSGIDYHFWQYNGVVYVSKNNDPNAKRPGGDIPAHVRNQFRRRGNT